MHTPRRFMIPLALIILLPFAGAWYLFQERAANDTAPLKASGTVETVEITVAPEVAGRVVEVMVQKGQTVEAGQPLFSMDDELLQSQHRRALAALDSAKAGQSTAQSGLDMAQAGLAVAQAGLSAARVCVEAAQVQYEIALNSARMAE
ncbi:MAG: biotin/lipoyl-binding protein, partial [Chloroflexota bacterium]